MAQKETKLSLRHLSNQQLDQARQILANLPDIDPDSLPSYLQGPVQDLKDYRDQLEVDLKGTRIE